MVLLAITWAQSRVVGDLYIALAAGRDIVNTNFACLTQPDTWSFTTTDRIWFNQNWGSHLIYYLAHLTSGECGLLALKAVLVIIMAVTIVMVCRQRGASLPVGIVTSGVAILAARAFIDLRPNLVTLMIAPLMVWLLYRSQDKPQRYWAVMLLAVIWANLHGGFIFGLGMMGLWAVCWLSSHAICNGIKSTFRTYWPILATLIGAVAFSGMLTPFGIKNLTHSFVVGSSKEWRGVREWMPIYRNGFGPTWEFYTTIGMLVGLSVLSCIVYLAIRKKRCLKLKIEQIGMLIFSVCLCGVLLTLAFCWEPEKGFETHRIVVLSACLTVVLVGGSVVALFFMSFVDGKRELSHPTVKQVAMMVFELCLAAIVITMAIKARRFIPLGIVLIAPMIAIQIQWLVRVFGRPWVIVPLVAALLLPAVSESRRLYKYYNPKNPLLPQSSLFNRMIGSRSFPPGAAEFINANDISGRIFNEWRWEGFLKWKCPQLKPFIGGRAQQVYNIETYRLHKQIIAKRDLSALSEAGIHLAIIPGTKKYNKLIAAMVNGSDARWACIYVNEHNFIFANTSSPTTKRLVENAAGGELVYPDPSIAALSHAMCLASIAVSANAKQISQAFIKANVIRPTLLGFMMLRRMASQDPIASKNLIPYFEYENKRLALMSTNPAGEYRNQRCRGFIADTLSYLYKQVNDKDNATYWAKVARNIRKQINIVNAHWK